MTQYWRLNDRFYLCWDGTRHRAVEAPMVAGKVKDDRVCSETDYCPDEHDKPCLIK